MPKLMIIRDAGKKTVTDQELPTGWYVLAVGDKIIQGQLPQFEAIICACELYTDADWRWYHFVLKHLRVNPTKDALWTN